MARKRMLSQTFWDDPDIAELTIEERLLFIGMVTYADDYGHVLAHPRTLRKWIFGFDDRVSVEMVQEWRDHLVRVCHNVTLYEVDGQQYVEFKNWEKHQDFSRYRGKPVYPFPPKSGVQGQSLPETASDEENPASPCQILPVPAGNSIGRGESCQSLPDPASPCPHTRSISDSSQIRSISDPSQVNSVKTAPDGAGDDDGPGETAAGTDKPSNFVQLVRQYEIIAGSLVSPRAREELKDLEDHGVTAGWLRDAYAIAQARTDVRAKWPYVLAIVKDWQDNGKPDPATPPGRNGRHVPDPPDPKRFLSGLCPKCARSPCVCGNGHDQEDDRGTEADDHAVQAAWAAARTELRIIGIMPFFEGAQAIGRDGEGHVVVEPTPTMLERIGSAESSVSRRAANIVRQARQAGVVISGQE